MIVGLLASVAVGLASPSAALTFAVTPPPAFALPLAVVTPATAFALPTLVAAPQATVDADFAQGVSAYQAGDYARAARLFAEVLEREQDPGRRAVIHANAGTAAARAERVGEAIWHLEAARRLNPREPLVARNLDLVRARLGESETEATQFTSTIRRLPLVLTPEESQRLIGIVGAAAILVLGVWRLRRGGRGLLWTSVSLLILCGGWRLADDLARELDGKRAVVVAGTPVRAEPSEAGSVLFRLAEGTIVSDEELRGDWRLVETARGGRGWAPVASVRSAGS